MAMSQKHFGTMFSAPNTLGDAMDVPVGAVYKDGNGEFKIMSNSIKSQYHAKIDAGED